MKQYRIIYSFKHPRMGFSNSITLEADNVDKAIAEAKKQVALTFGAGMAEKRFSFKPDPTHSGVAIR